MYGSMATGLAIDSSDMDLLISGIFENCMKVIDVAGIKLTRFVDRQMLIENMRRFFNVVAIAPSTTEIK
jgi:predicted nucleotidyltransferase